MKFKSILAVAGASAGLAGGLVAPVSAASARPGVPYASSVSLKLVVPSNIASNGAYQENLGEVNPSPSNCGFFLYRYTSWYGGWQSLGFYNGTGTNDLVQDYFNVTEYEIVPTDCNGNQGSPVYSRAFYPTTWDNAFSVISGSAKTVFSSKYYGGSVVQTTSGIGTRVGWNTDSLYNVGIVAGSGPQGGMGTVYVDGVKKGTINFYSSRVTGMKVVFKFGTPSYVPHTIDVVTTGRGSGDGYAMFLDAGLENSANPTF